MELKRKVEEALFEARPYVEYWDRLKEVVESLPKEDEGEFLKLLEEKIEEAPEPFKTDLRIFLQKFEGL